MSKVIVVGAGLSGLTSAYELHKSGHDVEVFEARDRVGGRTWTTTLEDGTLTERGGEWVFPIEFEVRQLGAELRLPVMSHAVRYSRRTLNGVVPSTDQLDRTTAHVRKTLTEMKLDGLSGLSVDEVYREALGENFRDDAIYRRLVISLSSDPALASAEATILYESATAGAYVEDGGRFVDGMQSLSLEMARLLQGRVHLESPVVGIDQSDHGVQIILSDGTKHEADFAVVSVPLPILETINFGFELDRDHQRAFSNRHMGTAAKLGVPVAGAGDDHAVMNPRAATWSWHSLGFDGETRIPALSNFAGGQAALEFLETAKGPERWIAELGKTRPDMQISGNCLLTDWTTDPWARGSYSAASLTWDPDDVRAFDKASGRVAFAGEHTGVQQSLNGAVRSGLRAAKVINSIQL